MKHLVAGIVLGLVVVAVPSAASAQPPSPPDQERGISPAEVQRMFDAYALVQAQDQLKLPDDQFSQFLPRFKSLQETRRRVQVERARLIQELASLSRAENADEGQIRNRLKDLKDLEARSAGEVRTAYDAIDQILDVRQQARFRVFEEQMERRKIELVVRARQNNRLKNRQ
jgi:hypothetical protein